jgi:hypothetical protein
MTTMCPAGTPSASSALRVTAETQSNFDASRRHQRSMSPNFAGSVALSANPGREYASSQDGSAFTSNIDGHPGAPRIAGMPPQGSR